MDIETVNEQPKKKVSKKLIALIIGALVLIGGTVSAFFLFNLSPKEQYFLAEKKSAEFISAQFKERFKSEMEWAEHTKENSVEQTVTLSAEYNDPFELIGDQTVQQMINNSALTIKGATDLKNKVVLADLQANISDLELSGLQFYLTSEHFTIGLPFLNELLQIDEKNFNKLLHEIDPYTFPDEETFKFDSFFEQISGTALEEDLNYLKTEYLEFLYKELPKDAFTSTTEKITVGNDDIKADKITMDLSEKDVKSLLHTLFDKMQNDEKLKEMIETQLSAQLGAQSIEVSEILDEFEEGLQLAKERLDTDLHIPNGITSTIWTKGDLIVQRDFSVELGPSEDDLLKLTVKGTQQLEKNKQSFDYDLGFTEFGMESTLNVKGDFALEKDKATDSLTFAIDGSDFLSYKGTETQKGKTKDFEREFTVDIDYGFDSFGGSLIWSGQATYDKDKMNSEHNLSLDVEGLDPNMFSLLIKSNAKTIKKVKLPEDKPTKDIGTMSMDELGEYIETDIVPQFEDWMFNTFGEFLGDF